MNFLRWDEAQVFLFFFILIRITSFVIFLPLLGDRGIPAPIKILFGLAMSFMIFPVLSEQGMHVPSGLLDSPLRIISATLTECLLGVLVGYVARWVFDAVQFAGYFTGTSVGFSMPSVLDPHSETQTIALAEMQYIMAALFFLMMDGLHLYIAAMAESFREIKIGEVSFLIHGDAAIQYLIRMTSEVVLLGIKLSAPILVVALLSNLTFSIIARAVSQMNVLVLSFIANLIVGFMVVIVSLPGFMNMVELAFEAFPLEIKQFMSLLHG